MARRQRIHYEGAFYHVIARGNNKAYILSNDSDKGEYLAFAIKYIKKYGGKLYAYVIMDNHVHLLIQVKDVPLSKIMQLVQQTYTSYYNRKFKQSGHVFEQRYKAVHCDKDDYLLQLVRYIHQNPARAGIGELDYKWSSHLEYIKGHKIICEVDEVLKMMAARKSKAIKEYIKFVSEIDEETRDKKAYEFEPEEIIGESIANDLEKRDIGEILAEFEQNTGYSAQDIMKKYGHSEMKSIRIKMVKEILKTTDMNQMEVAKYFNVSAMTISRYKAQM